MEPFRFLHGVPLACASLLIGAWPAMAQECLPVRARNPEGNYIVPGVQGEIVYRRVDGAELVLDAYIQRRGGLRPAVLVVHGGGWTSGSRVAFVGQLLETLTRAGFNWFSLDYRLGGLSRYADALDDLRAALAFVRCHAAEFRIDPQRVALLGEDAGAHLAALLAAEKPAGLRAAVLVGGFYDLSEASPLRAVSAGCPTCWPSTAPRIPRSRPSRRSGSATRFAPRAALASSCPSRKASTGRRTGGRRNGATSSASPRGCRRASACPGRNTSPTPAASRRTSSTTRDTGCDWTPTSRRAGAQDRKSTRLN